MADFGRIAGLGTEVFGTAQSSDGRIAGLGTEVFYYGPLLPLPTGVVFYNGPLTAGSGQLNGDGTALGGGVCSAEGESL